MVLGHERWFKRRIIVGDKLRVAEVLADDGVAAATLTPAAQKEGNDHSEKTDANESTGDTAHNSANVDSTRGRGACTRGKGGCVGQPGESRGEWNIERAGRDETGLGESISNACSGKGDGTAGG